MQTLLMAWGVSLVATGWLLPLGVIRVLAYRSGEVTRPSGMGALAGVTLALGILAAATFLILTVLLVIAGERP
ncbi:hypothetical protein [Nocardioides limicola]|uniref:hypothetical protein n=1 Tax=Nocardioides limicola TaxID=2803368 RepID=UPI00193C77C5|nr:hypothetical protein [Nocardioides sp. DJM-14]